MNFSAALKKVNFSYLKANREFISWCAIISSLIGFTIFRIHSNAEMVAGQTIPVSFIVFSVYLLIFTRMKNIYMGDNLDRGSDLTNSKTIWDFIDLWKPWYMQIAGVLLFALLLRAGMGTYTMSIALIVSMYVHEIFHFAFLVAAGIDSRILILYPLGGVAAPANQTENARSDELPWNYLGYFLLAGPFANLLLLAGSSYFLNRINDQLMVQFLKHMIEINLILGVSNMVPVWKLDAGQLYKFIFSSLTEKEDKLLSTTFTSIWIGAALVIWLSPYGQGWRNLLISLLTNGYIAYIFLFGLLFVSLMWWQQTKDDDSLHNHANSMTNWQAIILVVIYMAMMVGFVLAPNL